MGMFDRIHDERGREGQTKSFDRPNMDLYRITKDGTLERASSVGAGPNDTDYSSALEWSIQNYPASPEPKWE